MFGVQLSQIPATEPRHVNASGVLQVGRQQLTFVVTIELTVPYRPVVTAVDSRVPSIVDALK